MNASEFIKVASNKDVDKRYDINPYDVAELAGAAGTVGGAGYAGYNHIKKHNDREAIKENMLEKALKNSSDKEKKSIMKAIEQDAEDYFKNKTENILSSYKASGVEKEFKDLAQREHGMPKKIALGSMLGGGAVMIGSNLMNDE